MGIGLMGAFCEMAWNQGVDLYGYDDNRFLKAAQYVAKYNLGERRAVHAQHPREGRDQRLVGPGDRVEAAPVDPAMSRPSGP